MTAAGTVFLALEDETGHGQRHALAGHLGSGSGASSGGTRCCSSTASSSARATVVNVVAHEVRPLVEVAARPGARTARAACGSWATPGCAGSASARARRRSVVGRLRFAVGRGLAGGPRWPRFGFASWRNRRYQGPRQRRTPPLIGENTKTEDDDLGRLMRSSVPYTGVLRTTRRRSRPPRRARRGAPSSQLAFGAKNPAISTPPKAGGWMKYVKEKAASSVSCGWRGAGRRVGGRGLLGRCSGPGAVAATVSQNGDDECLVPQEPRQGWRSPRRSSGRNAWRNAGAGVRSGAG